MRAEECLIKDERAETTHVSAREIPQFLEAASISWSSEQQQVRPGQEGEILLLELGFSEPETCNQGDWRRHSALGFHGLVCWRDLGSDPCDGGWCGAKPQASLVVSLCTWDQQGARQ